MQQLQNVQLQRKQAGFTLIELVVVIVILGILAATAIPRFADMSTQAKQSAQSGLNGAVRSASALVHAQALVEGVADQDTTITLEGQSIDILNGYARANAAGIPQAVDVSDDITSTCGSNTCTFTVEECDVTYTYDGTNNPVIAKGACP